MNIHLPRELEQFVAQLMQSGRYDSESEIVCEALWLLQNWEDLRKVRIEDLRQKVAVGLAQLERGEYTEYDDNSLHELMERVKARGEEQLAKEGNTSRHEPDPHSPGSPG
jgi:antitoxin ParD1/3/4